MPRYFTTIFCTFYNINIQIFNISFYVFVYFTYTLDPIWSTWGQWGTCTKLCGSGESVRARTCSPPKFGDKKCRMNAEEQTKPCKTQKCKGKSGNTRMARKSLLSSRDASVDASILNHNVFYRMQRCKLEIFQQH